MQKHDFYLFSRNPNLSENFRSSRKNKWPRFVLSQKTQKSEKNIIFQRFGEKWKTKSFDEIFFFDPPKHQFFIRKKSQKREFRGWKFLTFVLENCFTWNFRQNYGTLENYRSPGGIWKKICLHVPKVKIEKMT